MLDFLSLHKERRLLLLSLVQCLKMGIQLRGLAVHLAKILHRAFRFRVYLLRVRELLLRLRGKAGELRRILCADRMVCGHEHRFLLLFLPVQRISTPLQLVLEIRKSLRLEKLLQDALALFGFRDEELSEIPLRQEDDLTELVRIEPDQFPCRRLDIRAKRRHFLPVDQFRERGLHRRLRLSRAALLIDELLRRAAGTIRLLADHEIKNDFRLLIRPRIVASHARAAPIARRLPIERIAHGIEDRGLARPRRPADEEEMTSVQFFEINGHFTRIGAESTHRQSQRFHRSSSFLYTVSQQALASASSFSDSSRSRNSLTKALKIS